MCAVWLLKTNVENYHRPICTYVNKAFCEEFYRVMPKSMANAFRCERVLYSTRNQFALFLILTNQKNWVPFLIYWFIFLVTVKNHNNQEGHLKMWAMTQSGLTFWSTIYITAQTSHKCNCHHPLSKTASTFSSTIICLRILKHCYTKSSAVALCHWIFW